MNDGGAAVLPLGRHGRWISMPLAAIAMAALVLPLSACATMGPSKVPEVQRPAPPDPPDKGATLLARTVELPPEVLKNSVCTAEDWRRIRSLRDKAFMSLYVVGPIVGMIASGYLYRVDRQLNSRDMSMSIGAGTLVGIGFGAPFLSKANSVQLACTFPR